MEELNDMKMIINKVDELLAKMELKIIFVLFSKNKDEFTQFKTVYEFLNTSFGNNIEEEIVINIIDRMKKNNLIVYKNKSFGEYLSERSGKKQEPQQIKISSVGRLAFETLKWNT